MDTSSQAKPAGNTRGGPDARALEALFTQAEQLAASVAQTLSDHGTAPALVPEGRPPGPGPSQPSTSSPPPSPVDGPADLESLLTSVAELGKDIASQLSGPSPPPAAASTPELIEGVPVEAEDSEPVATVMPDPALKATLEAQGVSIGGPQSAAASPPPAGTQPVASDDGSVGQTPPQETPAEQLQMIGPELQEALAESEALPPPEEGPGGLKLLWWSILQSPPIQWLDRLLTAINKPFAQIPKNARDLLGYGGILLVILGAAGLAMVLLGR